MQLQSTQTLLSRVPETTASEFDQAVEAAKEAFKTWSRTSVLTRQRFALEYATRLFRCLGSCKWLSYHVSRLQAQIRQNADALANSIVLEQGKTFAGVSPSLTRLESPTRLPLPTKMRTATSFEVSR